LKIGYAKLCSAKILFAMPGCSLLCVLPVIGLMYCGVVPLCAFDEKEHGAMRQSVLLSLTLCSSLESV
jgi:hypothetical protein